MTSSFHRTAVLAAALLTALFLSGCATTYWDPNWVYEGHLHVQQTRDIRVESEPSAALWVDGEYIGETPLDVSLTYTVGRIRLARHQYEASGSDRKLLDKIEKTEETITPGRHSLVFRASGFHDRLLPVTVPVESEKIHVVLRPRAGVNIPFECSLRVRAYPEQFAEVVEIFARHAMNPHFRRDAVPPADAADPEMPEETLRLTVRDAEAFDALMADLFATARKKQFGLTGPAFQVTGALRANPDREFRAVWLSYLDWPDNTLDSDAQKHALTKMLDGLKQLNINALIFQVRAECDAFYRSTLEPLSRFTGKAPRTDPDYDPLRFVIREAHARGMELHAWLNPYRTSVSMKCGARDPQAGDGPAHVSVAHPDWLLKFRLSKGADCCCYRMLDPGIPEVTDYIAEVVADIVSRYDVDGIHFDDMFYPYPQGNFSGIGKEDLPTYRKYRSGDLSLKDWRRTNINRMIRTVHDRIRDIKSYVRFGISPFGIWRSGQPKQARGMDAYNAIYADALAWLRRGSVDYLAPQLYWNIDGTPDYGDLLVWWAAQGTAAGRHIYPGMILYHVDAGKPPKKIEKPQSAEAVLDQIAANRDTRKYNVLGNTFYRALDKAGNLIGHPAFRNRLKEGVYATPALPPVMPWLDVVPPRRPEGLDGADETTNGPMLTWEDPNPAGTVGKYAIYVLFEEDMTASNANDPLGRRLAVTGERRWRIPNDLELRPNDRLYVTALSRNNVESAPSRMRRIEELAPKPTPEPPAPAESPEAEKPIDPSPNETEAPADAPPKPEESPDNAPAAASPANPGTP